RQPRGVGSPVSPDVGGFGGCGGFDALPLSPLALVGPLDTSGADDDAPGDERRGGGSGWGVPPAGSGVDCGLSPVRSARSESTFEFDDGPSSLQQSRDTPLFPDEEEEEEEEEENGDSGEIALTPEQSRSSRFAHACSVREKGRRDHGLGDLNVDAGVNEEDEEREPGGFMPPPPSRQPSLATRAKDQRHQHALTPDALTLPRKSPTPECRRRDPSSTNHRPTRPAFRDRTNEGRDNGGDDSRDQNTPSKASARGYCSGGGGGGGVGYNEQASIGSFTESEGGESRVEDSFRNGCHRGGKENGDGSSLVEGTPRRRGVGSGKDDLGGYYPPLQVATTATIQAEGGSSLTTLQRSTLRWMVWRERGEDDEGRVEGPGRGSASLAAATASFSSEASSNSEGGADTDVKGGVLGHLSSEEASTCVYALVKGGAAYDNNTRGATTGRGEQRRDHPGTGLPCGRTLILAPTKEAAWRWVDGLESGAGGLSVLSYVMPLKERRRISAKQAAAFDVVVTTYDVLKAKEVPRGVHPTRTTSPRRWALPGSAEWRTRNEREDCQKRPAARKTDLLVSVLHGVWWDRVVADGAQILVTQRSARAAAALSLLGTTRWCVVGRENMDLVESSSERMRSLAAFLRVPADVPLVQAAESLFYASRPCHVAPLHPRVAGGAADNSLSLNYGAGRRSSSPGASSRQELPRSRTSADGGGGSSRRSVDGDGGGRGARSGASGKREAAEGKGLDLNPSATRGNAGVVVRGGRGEAAGRKMTSRISTGGGENSRESRRGGAEGIEIEPAAGAAGGQALSRGRVTYASTTLKLRRAGGVGGGVPYGQKP
ncbi:unnamed protein product, partial [Hapterophycus canaliculatus]